MVYIFDSMKRFEKLNFPLDLMNFGQVFHITDLSCASKIRTPKYFITPEIFFSVYMSIE